MNLWKHKFQNFPLGFQKTQHKIDGEIEIRVFPVTSHTESILFYCLALPLILFWTFYQWRVRLWRHKIWGFPPNILWHYSLMQHAGKGWNYVLVHSFKTGAVMHVHWWCMYTASKIIKQILRVWDKEFLTLYEITAKTWEFVTRAILNDNTDKPLILMVPNWKMGNERRTIEVCVCDVTGNSLTLPHPANHHLVPLCIVYWSLTIFIY